MDAALFLFCEWLPASGLSLLTVGKIRSVDGSKTAPVSLTMQSLGRHVNTSCFSKQGNQTQTRPSRSSGAWGNLILD